MAEELNYDIIKERILEKLRTAEEVDPYKYDGSYEMVQSAARKYHEHFPESAGLADLDLFHSLSSIFSKAVRQKRIENCNLESNQKEELLSLLDKIYAKRDSSPSEYESDNGTSDFGMFRHAFYTFDRVSGVAQVDAGELVKLFASLIAIDDAEEKLQLAEEAFRNPIKGIKSGTASQILHCIDPYTFPILNGHQGRDSLYCLLKIGLPESPDLRNDLTRYVSHCRTIRNYRAENYAFKNYRVFDIVEFDLPSIRKNADPARGASLGQKAKAVEALADDAAALDSIAKLCGEPNLFRVLGVEQYEIRHSNALAWLLNPSETHGMGDAVLRRFIELVRIGRDSGEQDAIDACLRGDLRDFNVEREKWNIDVLLTSKQANCAIAIENKTGSGETGEQLKKYPKTLGEKKLTKEMKRYLVFLTPDEREPSNPDWQRMGYRALIDKVREALDEKQSSMHPDAVTIVSHYIRTVEEELLDDGELNRLCREVYARHRLALETIFSTEDGRNSAEDGSALDMSAEEAALNGKCREVRERHGVALDKIKGHRCHYDEALCMRIACWMKGHVDVTASQPYQDGESWCMDIKPSGGNTAKGLHVTVNRRTASFKQGDAMGETLPEKDTGQLSNIDDSSFSEFMGEIADACGIAQKLINMNTNGKHLSQFDIIVAQFEDHIGESLADRISTLAESNPKVVRYGNMNDLVFRTASLIQGRQPNERGAWKLDLEEMVYDWEAIESGLVSMATLLEGECVFDAQRLPTSAVLWVLAALYAQAPDFGDCGVAWSSIDTVLKRYVWLAFLTDRYDKAAATMAFQDYRALKAFFEDIGDSRPADLGSVPIFDESKYPLPDEHKIKAAGWPKKHSVLGRAILAIAAKEGALDFATGKRLTLDNIEDRQYHHIFPDALLLEAGIPESDRFCAVNCVLIEGDTNKDIGRKDPLDYLKDRYKWADDSTVTQRLESHLIPKSELERGGYATLAEDERAAKISADYDAFRLARAKAIASRAVQLCKGPNYRAS